ncbi:MAG: hypothetical protein ACOC8A_02555 [bacterium]
MGATKAIAALCIALLVCAAALADPTAAVDARKADTRTPIPDEQVTAANVASYFSAAYFDARVVEDGDVRIQEGGMKTFVKVNTERKRITFYSLWGMKDSVPEVKKLQFVNRLNSDLVRVRFYTPDAKTLICDYQLGYKGGVSRLALVSAYRTFADVVRGAVGTMDPEDIID